MDNSLYLFESLIKGDSKGILLIYEKVFPKVYSFILKNKGQKEDAEDVFQKTLLQLAIRFKDEKMKFTSSFEAYLFTACKNQWRRILNSQKKGVTHLDISKQESDTNEMAISIMEQNKWDLFQEKLKMLSDKCIEILRLYFKKKSHADIATLLSYSSSTVARQKVFKCRSRLSVLIKRDPRFDQIINGYE